MKKSLLDALRCPSDGTKLGVNKEEKGIDDDMVEGELICVEGHVWIVSNGIPSLVNMLEVSEEDLRWIQEYDEHAEE